MRFLSPFDPMIRERERTQRIFGFDYRFEAFVPAAKRVYGYYVLPMLERDRLVGRVELKTPPGAGRTGSARPMDGAGGTRLEGPRRQDRRRDRALAGVHGDGAGGAIASSG